MFELRTYTLKDRDAAELYAGTHWQRHVPTLAGFGITTHGVWLGTGDRAATVVALVSYAPGDDPAAVSRAFMSGDGFRADMAGFPMDAIVHVEAVLLDPASSSPLH